MAKLSIFTAAGNQYFGHARPKGATTKMANRLENCFILGKTGLYMFFGLICNFLASEKSKNRVLLSFWTGFWYRSIQKSVILAHFLWFLPMVSYQNPVQNDSETLFLGLSLVKKLQMSPKNIYKPVLPNIKQFSSRLAILVVVPLGLAWPKYRFSAAVKIDILAMSLQRVQQPKEPIG